MKLGIAEHEGKEQAGSGMYRLCRDYWPDIAFALPWDFGRWFDFVRLIPYIADDEIFPGRVVEVISRPGYLLDRKCFSRIDCKKKAILIGAWAHGNKFPYRFIAVSHKSTRDIHHVFPQIDFGDGWVNCDATFPEFVIGGAQPATYGEVLTP